MAIPNEINVQIRDASGTTGSTRAYVNNSHSLAQYNELAPFLVEAIDGFIGGVIENAKLTVPVDVSALIPPASVVADVQEIGQFAFRTAEGRVNRVNIPCWKETLTIVGGDDINLADPAVAAFTAAMLNGIAVTGGTIIPCDIGEGDLTTVAYGRERFRSRGRRG